MKPKTWNKEPPRFDGTYVWRRAWNWEPIERDITNGRTFSARYAQEVPVEKVGGEWFY